MSAKKSIEDMGLDTSWVWVLTFDDPDEKYCIAVYGHLSQVQAAMKVHTVVLGL